MSKLFRGRYRVDGLLGEGSSSSSVYRVFDFEQDRAVALKRCSGSTEISHLKREFRELAHLTHRNLVALYDLWSDEVETFYTMELIEGHDLRSFVQGADSSGDGDTRFARVLDVLPQLADALGVLHGAGIIHRDLKPENVLITAHALTGQSRLVLLDFGMLAATTPMAQDLESDKAFAGTPAYMAPEQLWDGRHYESSDWYAAAVMVFEALSGRLPFGGSLSEAVLAKRTTAVPALDGGVAPDWFADLLVDLTHPKPAQRPGRSEVLTRLGGKAGELPESAVQQSSVSFGRRTHYGSGGAERSERPFVGREIEQRWFDQRLASLSRANRSPLVLHVYGDSGIGKSEFMERMLVHAKTAWDALCFRGRCHLHESVPYQAFDQIAEDVSRCLAMNSVAASVADPLTVAAARKQFPSLSPTDGDTETSPELERMEPAEQRRLAALGLLSLFESISDGRPLVLWVDDAQWGDRDSTDVVQEVLQAYDSKLRPRLRLVLVLSYMLDADVDADSGLGSMLGLQVCRGFGARAAALRLDPLSDGEVAALVSLLAPGTAESTKKLVETVVRDSGGSPFLIEELVRAAKTQRHSLSAGPVLNINEVVHARLSRLSLALIAILRVAAMGDASLPVSVVLDAAGMGRERISNIDALERLCFLRLSGHPRARMVSLYHERIRKCIRDAIDPASYIALHAAIADALERCAEPNAAMLFYHCRESRRMERAAHYAVINAGQALQTLAFGRAADLLSFVVEHVGPRIERGPWLRALASALANDGQGLRAAQIYTAAADAFQVAAEPGVLRGPRKQLSDGGAAILECRCNAASLLLRYGPFNEGLASMHSVLRAYGETLPTTRGAVVGLAAYNRWRSLLKSNRVGEPGADVVASQPVPGHVKALRLANVSAFTLDTGLSVLLSARYERAAFATGDSASVSQALVNVAMWHALWGGKRRLARAREMLPTAHAWAARAGGTMRTRRCIWARG